MRALLRLLLAVGSITAIGLAFAILFLPGPFYAGYSIETQGNVSLLNELKAPAVVILVLGVLQGLAALRTNHQRLGLAVGTLLYLGFGTARVIAIASDGPPSAALLGIMGFELVFGLGFALALWRHGRVTQR